MRGARTNLASVDKRLNMMKAHRVMAVLPDERDRFCYSHPVVAHMVPLSSDVVHIHSIEVMLDQSLAARKKGMRPRASCWTIWLLQCDLRRASISFSLLAPQAVAIHHGTRGRLQG